MGSSHPHIADLVSHGESTGFLGSLWEASGRIWKASGRHLGLQEAIIVVLSPSSSVLFVPLVVALVLLVLSVVVFDHIRNGS